MGKGGQSQNLNWPWAINYIIERLKQLVYANKDISRIPHFEAFTAVATHTVEERFHNVTIYNIGGGAGTDVVTLQVIKKDGTYMTAVTVPKGTAYTFDAGGNANAFLANGFKIDISTSTGMVHVAGTIARPSQG